MAAEGFVENAKEIEDQERKWEAQRHGDHEQRFE